MTSPIDNWKMTTVGAIGDVFTGRTPPTKKPEYFGDDYPFITPGDMHKGKFARNTQRYLSEDGADLLKRIRLPIGSICVSCIGWQMGEVVQASCFAAVKATPPYRRSWCGIV